MSPLSPLSPPWHSQCLWHVDVFRPSSFLGCPLISAKSLFFGLFLFLFFTTYKEIIMPVRTNKNKQQRQQSYLHFIQNCFLSYSRNTAKHYTQCNKLRAHWLKWCFASYSSRYVSSESTDAWAQCTEEQKHFSRVHCFNLIHYGCCTWHPMTNAVRGVILSYISGFLFYS